MKQYKKYKPSGIEWLDDIPEHWKLRRVKELFVYDKGCTPESKNSCYYEDEDYEWATIGDISDNSKYLERTENYISQIAVDELGMVQSPQGSLLYSFKLSIGKVAFLSRDMFTNEAILSIFPTKTQNLNFWYYALPYYLKFSAKENIYGAPMLNDKLIQNAIIPAFPVNEQTAIATYLDVRTANIDRRIELLHQKIDHFKQLRRSLISQVVTRGLKPNVKLKPSVVEWLDKVPEHWNLRRIKDCAYSNSESLKEKYDNDFKINYVEISDVSYEEGITHISNLDYRTEAPSRARRITHKEDVIISTVRTYLKAVALIKQDDLIVSTGFSVLSACKNTNSQFLYYLVMNEHFIDAVQELSMGVSYPAITDNYLKSIDFYLPPLDEQIAIAEYLDEKTSQIDTIVSKCEKQIEQLTELRRSIISQVVTGQFKVC